MSSLSENVQLMKFLEAALRELIEPVERIQSQVHSGESGYVPDGLELIAGELTMVVLVFSNIDLSITHAETALLNNFRDAICGDNAFALTSDDYLEMCRRFLRVHPNRRLSIDQKPFTLQFLQTFDRQHGTDFAENAKAIFFQLAEAVVKADGTVKDPEMMTLMNFKEILDSPTLQS